MTGQEYRCKDTITVVWKKPALTASWLGMPRPRNCLFYRPLYDPSIQIFTCGVVFDRSMELLESIPKDTKVLALAPSVSSAPEEAFDQMTPRENHDDGATRRKASLLLNRRLGIDRLSLPCEKRPKLRNVRQLFCGVNVVDDLLAVHVPREQVVPRGLDPGRIRLLALPSFVEKIADEAFWGWQMLETVVFADDSRLRIIGQGAFRDSGLSSFAPPASLRVLGREALAGCRKLSHLVLNDHLSTLGERCFQNT